MKSSNDKVPEALARLQTSFAAHIRDPKSTAAPDGIEDRRMAIYRDLFFNNIKSFLSSNFLRLSGFSPSILVVRSSIAITFFIFFASSILLSAKHEDSPK